MPQICTFKVPESELARWAQEVAALPKRKRKNWKSQLVATTGTFHAVRYIDDVGFEVRTTVETRDRMPPDWKFGEWAPIVPFCSCLSDAQLLHYHGSIADRRVTSYDPNGLAHAFDAGGEDLLRQVHNAHVAANSTGNHQPRNHPIRVPTAPGQPVRS